MRRFLIALLALLLAAGSTGTAAFADCKMHHGDRVELYGGSDDPDVLVWDSRFRLREYHGASFDVRETLSRHADVVSPGTRAIVDTCVPDFVDSPLFEHPADAVGIVIVSGPHRGERGWVLSTDVRRYRTP